MEKAVLHVEGMACEHCARAIKDAVGALDGVASVQVNLSGKTVEVEHDQSVCPLERIRQEIGEQGYTVVG